MSNQPSALESDIEQARDQLASNIDQLLHRLHPKTIVHREVQSVKAHFVDVRTGEPRTENILKVAGGVLGLVTVVVVLRKITR